jgi:FMN reductase
MTTIAVISAGISVPSSTRILADNLASATVRALDGNAAYDVVELRELAHLLTDNVLTGFPTGALADAVIAVSPVYTGSYSGLFKMFFDVLEDGALEGKPVLIAATAGTKRHSLVLEFAMRPLFAYLRADVVPTAVFAASSDFGESSADHGRAGGSLSQRIDRAARELADKILRRGTTLPDDPFANPTPFEDLLRDI